MYSASQKATPIIIISQFLLTRETKQERKKAIISPETCRKRG